MKKLKGYTLLEIVVVIAISSIVAFLAISVYHIINIQSQNYQKDRQEMIYKRDSIHRNEMDSLLNSHDKY